MKIKVIILLALENPIRFSAGDVCMSSLGKLIKALKSVPHLFYSRSGWDRNCCHRSTVSFPFGTIFNDRFTFLKSRWRTPFSIRNRYFVLCISTQKGYSTKIINLFLIEMGVNEKNRTIQLIFYVRFASCRQSNRIKASLPLANQSLDPFFFILIRRHIW